MKPQDLRTPRTERPRQASALDGIISTIRTEMDEVERNIQFWAASPNPLIAEVGRYLFQDKGKRLRPAVLLLSSKVAGYNGPEASFLAALIEVIHTASLIHDDIIDNAATRRGKESVHAKWGPNITVLLGDFLFIKSIGLSLDASDGRVIRILADLSARMIEGELTEYFYSRNVNITEPQYLDIVDMKTASLFSAASRIGAVLGRLRPEQESGLMEVGRNFGMAFQIVDDLLDYKGQEGLLGKPVLSDLAEGRITLPLIHALNGHSGEVPGRLADMVRRKDLDEAAKTEVLDILRTRGSLDYSLAKASAYADDACSLLTSFPASPERTALMEIAGFILERET
jgi:octaprenyl-diphosphate synthase